VLLCKLLLHFLSDFYQVVEGVLVEQLCEILNEASRANPDELRTEVRQELQSLRRLFFFDEPVRRYLQVVLLDGLGYLVPQVYFFRESLLRFGLFEAPMSVSMPVTRWMTTRKNLWQLSMSR